MYGIECDRITTKDACRDKSCIFPGRCKHLPVHHDRQIRLLKSLRSLSGIRKVFFGSGIRYALILGDERAGRLYLEELLRHHVSGQLKIAPEHVQDSILRLMGKPGRDRLEDFIRLFGEIRAGCPVKPFLTYYLMAAHPGCTLEDMRKLRKFAIRKLSLLPEQVQIFTPTPSTWSSLMYYTERDPFSGEKLFVEKDKLKKEHQKALITGTGSRKRTLRKNGRRR